MRELRFTASSQKDLAEFPTDARLEAAYALELACLSDKYRNAKPLRGFGGANVLEIVCDDSGDAYRVVYTIRIREDVYVLHAS